MKVIRKVYWNFEKEEKWLNEMASQGLSLVKYSYCKYYFEETDSNLYTYRIELLEHAPNHIESIKYLNFLKESNIELINSYMNWVYLRKKTKDGSFDLYSDIDSKLVHYKRINTLWLTLAACEFTIGMPQFFSGLSFIRTNGISILNFIAATVCLFASVLFLFISFPVRRRIKELEKEKAIRE